MQLSQFQQIAGGYINKVQSLMKTWPSKLMAAGWMDGDWWRQRRAAAVSGGIWRARMCKKKLPVGRGRAGKLDGPAGILERKSKRGRMARRVRGVVQRRLGRVRVGYGGKGWWGAVMPTVNPKIKTQHLAEAKCNAAVIKAFPSTNESAGKRSIVNWIIYHHRDGAAAAMVTAAAAVWRPINGSCIKRSAVCPPAPWKVTWWLFSTGYWLEQQVERFTAYRIFIQVY